VGLRRRVPGRPRGGGLPGVQGAGLRIVPPTVFRDGPFGPGMCQLWIDTDESVDIHRAVPPERPPRAADMSVFDAVVNKRRSQDRPPAAGPSRASVRLRSWRLLRRGVQAPHRAVAVGAARSLPGRSVEALRRLQQCFETGDLTADLLTWLTLRRWTPPASGLSCCSSTACTRIRRRTGPPCPGRPFRNRPDVQGPAGRPVPGWAAGSRPGVQQPA